MHQKKAPAVYPVRGPDSTAVAILTLRSYKKLRLLRRHTIIEYART
jgi:hypothetical protein